MPFDPRDNTSLLAYLQQMEILLSLNLNAERREAVLVQLIRIVEMAQPLMAYPLESQDEVAGEYRL